MHRCAELEASPFYDKAHRRTSGTQRQRRSVSHSSACGDDVKVRYRRQPLSTSFFERPLSSRHLSLHGYSEIKHCATTVQEFLSGGKRWTLHVADHRRLLKPSRTERSSSTIVMTVLDCRDSRMRFLFVVCRKREIKDCARAVVGRRP
jgi:hypothetical protein